MIRTYLSIRILEPHTRPTVQAIFPSLCVLAADRNKVLLRLIRRKLLESTMSSRWAYSIGSHFSMVVEYLVLQTCFTVIGI